MNYPTSDISVLIEDCASADAHFHSLPPTTKGACFELFRRAVLEKSEPAWAAIYTQYRRQMLYWANGAEDVAHEAWEKFLHAVTPEVFVCFTSVAHILAYLKRCVKSVHIDARRKAEREQKYLAMLGSTEVPPDDTSEATTLNQVANRQLAEAVNARLQNDLERLVVRWNLIGGLTPIEIVQRYPQHFAEARAVSRIREKVILRLRNDPVLQRHHFDEN